MYAWDECTNDMVQVNRLSGDRYYAAYLIVGKVIVDKENTGQEMNDESSGEKRYWKRIATHGTGRT